MSDARTLIRELYADGEHDPHVVAGKALAAADDDVHSEFADAGAVYLARELIRQFRSTGPTFQPDCDIHLTAAGGGRWAEAAQQTHDLTLPYHTPGGWKRLADCTADDLDYIAARYYDRAARNHTVGDQFAALAEKVRSAGVATLGDLGDDDE